MMRFGLLILCVLTLVSCKKDEVDEAEQLQKDKEIIEKYLSDNGLTAQSTSSGLYYIINTPETGAQPTSTSNVTVAYVGYYISGSTFDSSPSTGSSFNLQSVIAGWTEGIPLFKVGGSGTLLIPSKLGYGPKGNSTIAGNTVILFDVELLSVN